MALDVLDGQTVAWYDNSTIFVLIYRLSLQEWDRALFIIMVSVELYLEYYLPTKLHQIAEDWRDLGTHNEENAPKTVYVLVKLSSFKELQLFM